MADFVVVTLVMNAVWSVSPAVSVCHSGCSHLKAHPTNQPDDDNHHHHPDV